MPEYRRVLSRDYDWDYVAPRCCESCGAVVEDVLIHNAWHKWFDDFIDAIPGTTRE